MLPNEIIIPRRSTQLIIPHPPGKSRSLRKVYQLIVPQWQGKHRRLALVKLVEATYLHCMHVPKPCMLIIPQPQGKPLFTGSKQMRNITFSTREPHFISNRIIWNLLPEDEWQVAIKEKVNFLYILLVWKENALAWASQCVYIYI